MTAGPACRRVPPARVSVLIPTLRRPASLERAVRSVLSQTGVEEALAEVVVIDNSPEASAREPVERLKASSSLPLVYVHEPSPGVATARNSGLRAAKGHWIAFLDDDEEATPGWLAALLADHARLAGDVTFGPIEAVIPDSTGAMKPYLERLFARRGPETSTELKKPYGCGNSVMTRATALAGDAPFDERMNETGGEDDALFARLAAQGRRFCWSAGALVLEHPEPHRTSFRWAMMRAFTYGQGPSKTAVRNRDVLGLLRWVVIGAGQTAVYGSAAAVLWLIGHPRRADMLDKTLHGLGKVLFMSAFQPKLYGRAAVARGDEAASHA